MYLYATWQNSGGKSDSSLPSQRGKGTMDRGTTSLFISIVGKGST